MLTRYLALACALFAFVGGLLYVAGDSTPPVTPTSSITLSNYQDELIHYATVDRPDNRSRDIFISPGAAEIVANNSTARLPDGTMIVIEAHSLGRALNGQLERRGIADNIHVAIKSSTWQPEDYQNNERAGDWNYFSFDPETGEMSTENVFPCFDCHANNAHIDFIFSRDSLIVYGESGEVQETFCNRPDRLPCR